MNMQEVTKNIIHELHPNIQNVLGHPIELCRVLLNARIIDEPFFTKVKHMVSMYNIDYVWGQIFKSLHLVCTVFRFEEALFRAGYKDISNRLNRYASGFHGQRVICSAVPCTVEKRGAFLLYLAKLKRSIYNGTDGNFVEYMYSRMNPVLSKYNPQEGTTTSDMLVVTLAVMLDSSIEKNELRVQRHGVISKLQEIIPKTRDKCINSMFLFSRMAVECALMENFEDGETWVNLALVHGHLVGNCVEKADMYFRIVNFYHRMFEHTKSKYALERLLDYGECGIRWLQQEEDVVRNQWQRLFHLRMAFGLLGMSSEYREIMHPISSSNLELASQYLANVYKARIGIEKKTLQHYTKALTRLQNLQGQKNEGDVVESGDANSTGVNEQVNTEYDYSQVPSLSGREAIDVVGISEYMSVGDEFSDENITGVNEQVPNVSDYPSCSGPEAMVFVSIQENMSFSEQAVPGALEEEEEFSKYTNPKW